jgi:glycosyltransferase 2 family protein
LLLVLCAAAIAFLAVRWKEAGFEWRVFFQTFQHVDWGWIVAGAGFALLTYLGRALRWRILIRGEKSDASLWRLAKCTAIGFTAIVLFGRPGEVVRPYLISLQEKVSFSSQVAAWLTERIYDLLAALLLFGLALSHVQSSGVSVGPKLEWVLRTGGYAAGVAAAVSLGVLVAFARYGQVMERHLLGGLRFLPDGVLAKIKNITSAFRRGMAVTGKAGVVYLLVLYSLLQWALILACYYCVFRGYPATMALSLTDVAIFVGFAIFGAAIQIPGVGGGLQVVSVIILTELFKLRLEEASGIAILLWAVTFVVIVPLGLVLALTEGLNWRNLRSIEEEVEL